jgi:hypothetical protein
MPGDDSDSPPRKSTANKSVLGSSSQDEYHFRLVTFESIIISLGASMYVVVVTAFFSCSRRDNEQRKKVVTYSSLPESCAS